MDILIKNVETSQKFERPSIQPSPKLITLNSTLYAHPFFSWWWSN